MLETYETDRCGERDRLPEAGEAAWSGSRGRGPVLLECFEQVFQAEYPRIGRRASETNRRRSISSACLELTEHAHEDLSIPTTTSVGGIFDDFENGINLTAGRAGIAAVQQITRRKDSIARST